MKKTFSLLFLLILAIGASAFAQDKLAQIDNLYSDEIKYDGFVLDSRQELNIDVVAIFTRDWNDAATTAWIINSETRKVVWESYDSDDFRRGRSGIRETSDTITLDKGNYEVYYSSYLGSSIRLSNINISGLIRNAISGRDRSRDRRDFRELKIEITGNGRNVGEDGVEKFWEEYNQNTIVNLSRMRDEEYEEVGFKLEREMKLKVYAMGEELNRDLYDYGFILNAKNRKRVWEMDFRNIEWAGGGEKNVMVMDEITLPAGEYVAYYISDVGHSWQDWNVAPPYDPNFWGMTISVTDPGSKNYVKEFDFREVEMKNVIVDLTRARDDEYLTKGFTLKKDMDVNVYVIGEGSGKDMSDFGWIVDAQTFDRVWEMDYYDTDHAGGARKNRLADETINLKKGSYVAYFVTDDSHSYRDWNETAPFDQDRYGMTISGADDNFNPDDVEEYIEEENKNILVKMVRFRDDDFERKTFTLEERSQIRIYAIGEGTNGTMLDYGWIENAESRRTVWEMKYRYTDHAGGGTKNRMINEVITLEPGEYVVYYETDVGHSYQNWNVKPPYDPINWGITVYLIDK
ncbi:hypothetical protein ACFL6O_03410 [candidate division KSB1 bacterium]